MSTSKGEVKSVAASQSVITADSGAVEVELVNEEDNCPLPAYSENNDPTNICTPDKNKLKNHSNYPSDGISNTAFDPTPETIEVKNFPSLPTPTISNCGEEETFQNAVASNINPANFITEKPISDPEIQSTEKKVGGKEYKGIKKYIGLLFTLNASFCFSLTVLFVSILKKYGFAAYEGSFWRYSGTVVPAIPLLLFYECVPAKKKGESVFDKVWPPLENENWKAWLGLLCRGLIGSTAVVLRYYALQYLTIGDTSVITFSTPALVTIMAHFFLGEKCGVFPILVAIVTLCGLVVVTKPPILTGQTEFDSDTLTGTAFALGSLLCAAMIIVITRKIRAVHFTVMTLVFGIIGVAQALVFIFIFGEFNLPTELSDTLLVGGVSLFSFIGQMSIILALKFEQAGPVALVRSCDVLFAFLFQYFFQGVIPDIFSVVGAVVVLGGVLSTAFRKWIITLPEEDKRRKRFWFVLR